MAAGSSRSISSRLAGAVVRLELVSLLLLAPLLLFPTPARSLVLLGIPAIWFSRRLSRGRFIDRTPLDWSVTLMALMVLASLYATYDLEVSLPKVAGILFGFAVFYAVGHLARSPAGWLRTLGGVLIVGSGIALLGLLGSRWLDKFPPLIAITGMLPSIDFGLPGAEQGFHPNEVAGALLWVAPLGLAATPIAYRRCRHQWGQQRRAAGATIMLASLAAAILITGTLILTQSRSGLLGLTLTLATGAVLAAWAFARTRSRSVALAVCVVCVVFAGGLAAALMSTSLTYTGLVGADQWGEGALSLDTLSGRFEVWSRAIYALQDFPLTGMGMNTFRGVVHVLYPLFSIAPDADIGHAHNEFLQAGLDLGLPGLIAFVAVNLGALAMLAKLWRCKGDLPFEEPSSGLLILGLAGGLGAHVIYGMLDAVALGAKPGFLWWWLLGLIASLYRLQVTGNRYQASRIRQQGERKSQH